MAVDPPHNDVLFHERLAHLHALPGSIKERIDALADNQHISQDLCLRWYPPLVEGLVQLNLLSSWGDFIDRVTDSMLLSLEVCSQALTLYDGEPSVDAEQLRQLRERVYELLQEVLESELDLELKRFVLAHLRRIADAIDDYAISGITPLREAVYVAMGNVAHHAQKAKRWKASDVWDKFSDVVQTAAAVATLLVQGPQLLGYNPHHEPEARPFVEIVDVAPAAPQLPDRSPTRSGMVVGEPV